MRVEIENEDLILVGASRSDRVPASSIRRVGVARRYSKTLVVLVIIVAAISIYTQDVLHMVFTLIMLGLALVTCEEVLVVETNDGRVLAVGARDRRSIRRVAEELSKLLTR